MSDSLFLFKRKEIIVPVKKLDVTTEKNFFIQWNKGKRANRKNTDGISDYLEVTHVGSQILNRDSAFHYNRKCLLKVL
jgi:hypothetical protein